MLFNTISSILLYLYLFYQYCNARYPEQTQEYIYSITYSCLYVYSKCQIILTNIKNILCFYMIDCKPEFYNLFISQFGDNNNDEFFFNFILKNQTILTLDKTELTFILESNNESDKMFALLDDCDFVLMNDNENNFKIIQKLELNLENMISETSELLKIQHVSYEPLLCELLIDDDNIKIDFKDKNGKYNYLIVNNYIDSKFLSYFMKEHYNILDIENYILRILDDSVQTMIFDKTTVLHFDKTKMIQL